MTDKQKAETLAMWIESVIAIHGVDEGRRVWDACVQRKEPVVLPPAKEPPKPMGWLK